MTREPIHILIPAYWPQNVNQTAGRHWAAKNAERRRAMQHIHAACLCASILPDSTLPITGKVRVTIERRMGKRQRAMDPDNVTSAAKCILDVLRLPRTKRERHCLGIIEGDEPDRCELHMRQVKSEDGSIACAITIEPVDERVFKLTAPDEGWLTQTLTADQVASSVECESLEAALLLYQEAGWSVKCESGAQP